ncbi:hypothetical protein P153DRAFT_283779, partial [Dothidotthia symphoricarpi CBS 119687]
ERRKTRPCPYCPEKKYTGEYAHRNWMRHMENKHNPSTSADGLPMLPCRCPGCGRSFQRTDARLVHERRSHPELNTPPAMKRTKSNSP